MWFCIVYYFLGSYTFWLLLPSHEIATSSVWSQWLTVVRTPSQSCRLNSVPSQSNRFKKMGPEPGPYSPWTTCAAKNGIGKFYLFTSKPHWHVKIINGKIHFVCENVLLLLKPPNWAQATAASWAPNKLLHTVPQALLMQISTLPACDDPFATLMSPSLQFPSRVEMAV